MKPLFNILIDFKKSKGSYIYDKVTNKKYLDFFGMYSSLPLGYNHVIFDKTYENKIKYLSKVKVCNNLFLTNELKLFETEILKTTNLQNIHYTCTGSLAIESAIKCAMQYKKVKNPIVLSLSNDYHGANSWGFISDFPNLFKYFIRNKWKNIPVNNLITLLETSNLNNVVAVVIEPIQCTAGDIYLNKKDIKKIEYLCRKKGVCFIVDEVQTGFGVTGYMWYSDYLGITPDILVFGKKSQISGILVSNKYKECIYEKNKKLEVTFDGDTIDALRGEYILKAYKKYNILNKVRKNQIKFKNILVNKVLNYRGIGHLICFDFINKKDRNTFVLNCFNNNLLVNPTGEVSVRLRPNLDIFNSEIHNFKTIMDKIL